MPDPEDLGYRLNFYGKGLGCLELGLGGLEAHRRDLSGRLLNLLQTLIPSASLSFTWTETLEFKSALNFPNFSEIESFENSRNHLQSVAKNLFPIGPALSLYSLSFNDQILQGLQVARNWE